VPRFDGAIGRKTPLYYFVSERPRHGGLLPRPLLALRPGPVVAELDVGAQLIFLALVGPTEGVGSGDATRSGEFVFPTATGVGAAEDISGPVFGFRVLCSGHGELPAEDVLLGMLPLPSQHGQRDDESPRR
jgi:hypothetical protein